MLILFGIIAVIIASTQLVIPALDCSNRRLASFAGWLVCFVPILIPIVIATKSVGPVWWFATTGILFKPWLNIALLLVYVLWVPCRGFMQWVRSTREMKILFERTRSLNPEIELDLRYQELCDVLGITKCNIYISPDISTGYAVGVFNKKILLPAEIFPREMLGGSEFWASASEKALTVPELRTYIAHELAHHVDNAGFRNAVIGFASLVIPREFVLGYSNLFNPKIDRSALRHNFVILIETISSEIATIGKRFLRIIRCERNRQEWVADQLAESVIPGAKIHCRDLRKHYVEGDNEGTRNIPTIGSILRVVLAIIVIGSGFLTLPGRGALLCLTGIDVAIPWHLPSGWVITDYDTTFPVRFAGYIPKRMGEAARICVEYIPNKDKPIKSFLAGNVCITPESNVSSGAMMTVRWVLRVDGKVSEKWRSGGYPLINVNAFKNSDPTDRMKSEWYSYSNPVRPIPIGKGDSRFLLESSFEIPPGDIKNLEWRFSINFIEPGIFQIEKPNIIISALDMKTQWLIEDGRLVSRVNHLTRPDNDKGIDKP